ncbi:MAG: PHP domain-containing protein [Spirochaetales bacterium]|nr:PHP domain-containing protein [Spirochaetales bacterium]
MNHRRNHRPEQSKGPADLHVHSRHSDGSQSVEELIREAAEKGLGAISLTDHDTVSSLPEALLWGERLGVNVIPGIEISAFDYEKGRKIHLLGYGFRPEAPHITALCAPLRQRRHENTLRQIGLLEKAGYPVTLAEVEEEAAGAPCLYKQQIMMVLIKKGLTDSIFSPLYKKLFKGDGICRGDIEYVDVFDALEAIKADGGYPVLAHPGQQDSFDLVPRLAEKGLWGLELNHEDNSPEDRTRLEELARRYDLALTGGSDTHGVYGAGITLGSITAPAGLKIPQNGTVLIPRREIARQAMEECARYLNEEVKHTPEGEWKGGDHSDLVTKYDREVETRLVRALSAAFPEDRFLTEEEDRGTDLNRGIVWIIDPIDGTTNFVHRQKDYAISVACYRDGEPWFGLVKDVAGGDLYEAVAGEEARLNGKRLPPLPSCSPNRGLKQALVDFSINTAYLLNEEFAADLTQLAPLICGHRAYGAASLILCRLAKGEGDIYLSAKLSLWDYAAAGIILREVGGDYRRGRLSHPEKGLRSGRLFLARGAKGPAEEMEKFLINQGIPREDLGD